MTNFIKIKVNAVSDKTYTIKFKDGQVSCSCISYRTSPRGMKCCKHLEEALAVVSKTNEIPAAINMTR